MSLALSAIFWASTAAVVYVYAGFPLLLWFCARGRRRAAAPGLPESGLPSISLLVAALNEEEVIEEKIKNSLALDYPADKLELVFVSDGSTDRTNEILLRYQGPRVKVLILPQRGGKMRALKQIFPLCRSEILVLSDANTFYRRDALRKLVRHFADPQVGAATGDVRIRPSQETFGQGEGAYYKYERWLFEQENAFWSVVGVDGAMYALRRRLLVPPSDNIILDDFVISMNAARQGFRIVYDPEAIAEEDPTPATGMEFKRKVRIVAGGYQALMQREGLPRAGQFRLMWLYVSHKLLRWLVPVFLVLALAASAALAAGGSLLWNWALGLQMLFYALAAIGWKGSGRALVFRIPFYFALVNTAALAGLLRALRRRESVLWQRGARSVTPLESSSSVPSR